MNRRIVSLVVGMGLVVGGIANADPCQEPDDGTGTVSLPPDGCAYLSPDEVHLIIDGLPAGTTIELDPIHWRFICELPGAPPHCGTSGGSLGGETEPFSSDLRLRLRGTGTLAGFNRVITVNANCQTETGPRNPGDAVQDFGTEMVNLQGSIFGDPDFDQLTVLAGSAYGLPSPGHTTLTRLGPPGSDFAVDSFFDITYKIDFIGATGSILDGLSGTTTGTVRVQAEASPAAVCPVPDNWCVGLQSYDCLTSSSAEACLPRIVYVNPGAPPVIDVSKCGCFGSNGCGGITITDILPLPPTDYLLECLGACPTPGVCEVYYDGVATGMTSVPASSVAAGVAVTCECPAGVSTCGPTADQSACQQAQCAVQTDVCSPACVNYDPLTGLTKVTDCQCRDPADCQVVGFGTAGVGRGVADPCVVTNGAGTIELPPQGCDYLSPDAVHMILDGLPAGATIELAAIHKDFICNEQGGVPGQCSQLIPSGLCEDVGGSLGGNVDCFTSGLQLQITGTGTGTSGLGGFARTILLPAFTEVHTAPRTPGDPVQDFATDMFRLFGEITGDPDFDLLRVTAGTDFGLPSPGHTTLTQLPSGDFAVDSFFDITYQIDYVGALGGVLDGLAGTTVGTIRMATGTPPSCAGTCPTGTVCVETQTVNTNGTIDICCDCVGTPQCVPLPDGSACQQSICTNGLDQCSPRCVLFDPATGLSTVVDCDCRDPLDCQVGNFQVSSGVRGAADPCVVVDTGGTISLPPAGCDYLSPDDVHAILDGLPAGATIELATIHKDFWCLQSDPTGQCSQPPPPGLCEDVSQSGGSLGGNIDCFMSTLGLTITGTGTGGLGTFARNIPLPAFCEVHTGPRTAGDPVQAFDTDMYRLFGEITSDPDFDLLRITAGTDFGLPSPGHTTLTQLPGGTFAVDSFFDITYKIDYVGAPGGALSGMSGSTTGTIRMQTGTPPSCVGSCPAGALCRESTTVTSNGLIKVCCDCVTPKTIVSAESCFDHGGIERCLPLGAGGRAANDNIEGRLQFNQAGALVLRVTANGNVNTASATVDCGSGVVPASVTANGSPVVDVTFNPALPDQSCCTVTFTGDIQDSQSIKMIEGDVDKSGDTTTSDVTEIKQRLGQSVPPGQAQYDLNNDGGTTTADVTEAKQRLGHFAPSPCP